MKYLPVTINQDSFLFCRFGLAVLLWLALIFSSIWLVLLTFVIFLLSAILGVNRSPMIKLFDLTIGRLVSNRKKVVVDVHDIRFVHILAAGVNLVILLLLALQFETAALGLLFIFAILKTVSAFGYCPASKLRTCVLGSNGSCCSASKIIRR